MRDSAQQSAQARLARRDANPDRLRDRVAACILGAHHKPHPNSIKVAVVGAPARPAPLLTALANGAGRAFDISQMPTVAQAMHDVRGRDLASA